MIKYKSIDLFAGIGGIRLGFERAFQDQIETVFVSEWDEYAQKTYQANFCDNFPIAGDITKISELSVPDFDICLAGFPCQAFSLAGQHKGFEDNYKGMCRGTLFMDVARICEVHKPKVIFCENVKGLTIHDKGRTFRIICKTFEDMGYKVFHSILNSKDFGVPQNRERIYIVAFRNDIAPEEFIFPSATDSSKRIKDILEEKPVPARYYLSDVYVETLRQHKARHVAKGNGFGYEIRDWDSVAGAIVCGGMGRERNLVIDKRQTDLIPTTHIKGTINDEGIRKMTPREWARLQGFPDSYKLTLADVHLYRQLGNSVTVNVIEAIAKQIRRVLTMQKANKGEWSEPYAAMKMLGDGKLYIADNDGNQNMHEWMSIIELIRHEAQDRIVTYRYNPDNVLIDIYVNGSSRLSVPANDFFAMAEQMRREILAGSSTFSLSENLDSFLRYIEIRATKAKSVDKSDVFLTITDPRAAVTREHIGFSIKSEFGQPTTLFNTATATAAEYVLSNMTDDLMSEINSITNDRGDAAVSERCDALTHHGCAMDFVGYAYAPRAGCRAFQENLDTIDTRLIDVIRTIMENHFVNHSTVTTIPEVMAEIIRQNPCDITRPEVKYPYMIKSFLYASYCGMTGSTLWDGNSQVNGGLIKVTRNGDVIAYYALESDSFKSYLYNNCFIDYPSTGPRHGHYGSVYKENDLYGFRLNFQIRYR